MADDIEKNAFKDQPKESLERLMEALKRVALGELSQGQIDATNSLKSELERFMLVGKAVNLLCGRIEEYVDWASRGSRADSLPAKLAQSPNSTAKEQRQQDLSSEEEEEQEYSRHHYRVGPSKNERLNALRKMQAAKDEHQHERNDPENIGSVGNVPTPEQKMQENPLQKFGWPTTEQVTSSFEAWKKGGQAGLLEWVKNNHRKGD